MPVSRRGLFKLARPVDYDGAAERVRAEWAREGHAARLREVEPVATRLVEHARLQPGWRVLDAAAGDGNVALAAAAVGADVDACDFTPEMVARGRERVRGRDGAAPAARFALADVQALPYPDGTFDAVLSAFGFALAPRAKQTARELARVCKPGGTVALAAWLPGGPFPDVPRPDGVVSPELWSDEARVRDRLEPLLDGLELQVVDGRYVLIRGVRRPTRPARPTS